MNLINSKKLFLFIPALVSSGMMAASDSHRKPRAPQRPVFCSVPETVLAKNQATQQEATDLKDGLLFEKELEQTARKCSARIKATQMKEQAALLETTQEQLNAETRKRKTLEDANDALCKQIADLTKKLSAAETQRDYYIKDINLTYKVTPRGRLAYRVNKEAKGLIDAYESKKGREELARQREKPETKKSTGLQAFIQKKCSKKI